MVVRKKEVTMFRSTLWKLYYTLSVRIMNDRLYFYFLFLFYLYLGLGFSITSQLLLSQISHISYNTITFTVT